MEEEKRKKKKKKSKNKPSVNPLPLNDSNVNVVPRQVDSSEVSGILYDFGSVVKGKTADENHEHLQLLQEKANLEEKVRQCVRERDANLEEVVGLKQKLNELLNEKAVLSSNMYIFKLKVNELLNEKAILSSDLESLQQMVNNLQNEKNILASDMGTLKEKVNELVNENAVQSTSMENVNSEIEAAGVLIEKLITENSELVEKLNEMSIKNNPSNMEMVLPVEVESNRVEESKVPLLEQQVIVRSYEDNAQLSSLKEDSSKEDEVVICDLKEDEVERPISDAPLIGAPFRLMSFMARYVTGADLLHNDSFT